MKIVLATHNEGKLVELNDILAEQLGSRADELELVTAGALGLADPVETGVSFKENALLKARFVAQETGLPAIADDSGLVVDILGMAPGILSARWAGVHGDDAANNALLLRQLADIPAEHRLARFVCCAALVTVQGEEVARVGEMHGTLLTASRGENGFGYDPLFVPDAQPDRAAQLGTRLTSAELTPVEKNAVSHRGKAFRALVPSIEALINANNSL